jgi:hypothetical protein
MGAGDNRGETPPWSGFGLGNYFCAPISAIGTNHTRDTCRDLTFGLGNYFCALISAIRTNRTRDDCRECADDTIYNAQTNNARNLRIYKILRCKSTQDT